MILNPESVMLNLFQHLFRACLLQHLIDPESSSKVTFLRYYFLSNME
jgi:hypothetical protein